MSLPPPSPDRPPLPTEVAAILARRIPAAWRSASAAPPPPRPLLRLIETPPSAGESPGPLFAWLCRLAREGTPILEVERGGLDLFLPRTAASASAPLPDPHREAWVLHPARWWAEASLAALARRRTEGVLRAACFVLLPRELGSTALLWREAGALDVFVSPRRLPELVAAARHRLAVG